METTLLICSGGGHLKQLFTLAGRMGIPPEEQLWVTFDNGLSRSLLDGRRVAYVPFAAPRDGLAIARIGLIASKMLSNERVDMAISTGSSPAVAFLPQAVGRGIPSLYIESAARADGPSLSGKIVSRFRRISTYTQYPSWADDRWLYGGSIFDEFEPLPLANHRRSIAKAVVSVGTQEGYGFSRLYTSLVPLLSGSEVLWQTGSQDVSGFGIEGRESVLYSELEAAVGEADVVVSHAGTGAALTAIEAGKCPVLVPRLARYNEHVDDHQVQIARELSRRGLAIMCNAEDLTSEVLLEAASRSTARLESPPPFGMQYSLAKSA